ncbi:oxidoreductase [Acidocella aquatica]|uniref:Oxidoreductase n=1 Tax=Acidocella aquatica TaxID=1922313 RepID=A0ABQ6A2I5_9PROT|nr:Gfo/Idh/MocA family oxidoreductase [Acidocella aquatica]GLR65460.1 oxidoreductase [Acidocella aquatica]
MASNKIRVGIIGVQPDRSWAAIAHIPALQALPDYEITAVSTTRQESADAAAARYGIARAFNNHQALVNSPDVDVVAVTVKVPHHKELVLAALNAGKHVYCEWPLGNGLAEAEEMAALAKAKGLRGIIGLQARMAPPVVYARDLIAQGYIGDVLSTSLLGTGMAWGEYVDAPNAYTADLKNGATMLTIPVSHTLDALCHVLGEVREVSGLLANRRNSQIQVETGAVLPMTAPDQVALTATLESGAVLSAHYIGGMTKGTGLLWEINGARGDLRFSAAGGHAQIFDLTLEGANAEAPAMQPLPVPESYYHSPLRQGPAVNVAEVYAQLARDLREGTSLCADFSHAVRRHLMVAAIERSAASGARQTV